MVSIIVPVYNAENTINKCVASILNQRLLDKEIILVNDGSQDGSLEILRRLEAQHNEIIVVDKTNGGVSSARNAGLKVCTGEYVTFIDSDDYYLSDTYISNMAKFLDESETVDLVVAGYTVLTSEQRKPYSPNVLGLKDIHEVAEEYWRNGSGSSMNSPCNKIFRTRKINNTFCEQMTMGEDAVFVLQYLKNCSQVVFCDDCSYGYVYENASSTTGFRKNIPYDMKQSRIYHNAMHDMWETFLPTDVVAENYIQMRTDEVLHMMRSLLQKKGLREYLQRDIADVIADDRFLAYFSQFGILLESYPHKKLARAIARFGGAEVKMYCLLDKVRRKLRAVTRV